jgi:hypothetical protein
MSQDETKLTRRLFLQHSATASAATAWYSVAMKTDALAEAEERSVLAMMNDGILPYSYHEGSR